MSVFNCCYGCKVWPEMTCTEFTDAHEFDKGGTKCVLQVEKGHRRWHASWLIPRATAACRDTRRARSTPRRPSQGNGRSHRPNQRRAPTSSPQGCEPARHHAQVSTRPSNTTARALSYYTERGATHRARRDVCDVSQPLDPPRHEHLPLFEWLAAWRGGHAMKQQRACARFGMLYSVTCNL